jgi:short-chain Z-isoprenyl diphosphate synthase
MRPRAMVEAAYTWWLWRHVRGGPLPRHVALIMDGNRRWARQAGFANASLGHQYGAEHLEKVLRWCSRLGISMVTAWVASADNIRKRDPSEVAFLMHLAETTIPQQIARTHEWRVHLAGQMDMLPDSTVRALKAAEEATRGVRGGGDLTIAIGYSGREEIVNAIRDLFHEAASDGRSLAGLAATVDERDIAAHLYNPLQAPPDVVIRTSGEQRMSDFLLWQAAHADLYFVDALWPSFRHLDLLRVLRDYAARTRSSMSGPG